MDKLLSLKIAGKLAELSNLAISRASLTVLISVAEILKLPF
jgi:hypothetical protein